MAQECVPQQLHNLIEVMQLHGIFSKVCEPFVANFAKFPSRSPSNRRCVFPPYLASPQEGSELDGNALWNQTWTTVHRFCPDLTPPESDASAKDESDGKDVSKGDVTATKSCVVIADVRPEASALSSNSGGVVTPGVSALADDELEAQGAQ